MSLKWFLAETVGCLSDDLIVFMMFIFAILSNLFLLVTPVSKVSGESTVSRVTSSNGASCTYWDLDEEDMGTDEETEVPNAVVNPSDACQRFSSELRKKFEVRLITVTSYYI